MFTVLEAYIETDKKEITRLNSEYWNIYSWSMWRMNEYFGYNMVDGVFRGMVTSFVIYIIISPELLGCAIDIISTNSISANVNVNVGLLTSHVAVWPTNLPVIAKDVLNNFLSEPMGYQSVTKIYRFLAQSFQPADGDAAIIQCGYRRYLCCVSVSGILSCEPVLIPAFKVL